MPRSTSSKELCHWEGVTQVHKITTQFRIRDLKYFCFLIVSIFYSYFLMLIIDDTIQNRAQVRGEQVGFYRELGWRMDTEDG